MDITRRYSTIFFLNLFFLPFLEIIIFYELIIKLNQGTHSIILDTIVPRKMSINNQ